MRFGLNVARGLAAVLLSGAVVAACSAGAGGKNDGGGNRGAGANAGSGGIHLGTGGGNGGSAVINPGGGTCEANGGSMRCLQIRVGTGSVRMCALPFWYAARSILSKSGSGSVFIRSNRRLPLAIGNEATRPLQGRF